VGPVDAEKGPIDANDRAAKYGSLIRMKRVTRVIRLAFRPRAVGASLAIVATCVFVIGCGSRRTPPPVQSIGSGESATEATGDGGPDSALADQAGPGSNEPGEAPTGAVAGADNTEVDRTQLVAVGPEDAKRGSTITGGGIITEPLKQFFSIQHRIVFDQIKHAEQLYKGLHGRMPKTHEEYMKEIIEANEIALPELDAGWDYYYDAPSERLMQRRVN
jgi:hypothetical protein